VADKTLLISERTRFPAGRSLPQRRAGRLGQLPTQGRTRVCHTSDGSSRTEVLIATCELPPHPPRNRAAKKKVGPVLSITSRKRGRDGSRNYWTPILESSFDQCPSDPPHHVRRTRTTDALELGASPTFRAAPPAAKSIVARGSLDGGLRTSKVARPVTRAAAPDLSKVVRTSLDGINAHRSTQAVRVTRPPTPDMPPAPLVCSDPSAMEPNSRLAGFLGLPI
jgi:hypothetical protein